MEGTVKFAKLLGFSTIGINLGGEIEEVDNVAKNCEKYGLKYFFRVNCTHAKKVTLHYSNNLFIADNIKEAHIQKFDLLESGKTPQEVTEVSEFCLRHPNLHFLVEIDFNPLRSCGKELFTNYLGSLVRLMKICKKRKITTVFASSATSQVELVSPRVLYYFYLKLGGNLQRKEVLSIIPNSFLERKFQMKTKVLGKIN